MLCTSAMVLLGRIKMRILFISTNLPVPPNSGQAIRTLSILQAMASSSHELSFLSFASRGKVASFDPLSSYCRDIDLIERPFTNMSAHGDYLRRALSLLSLKSYSIERFRSGRMRSRIQTAIGTKQPDLIVCDSLYALVNVPPTKVPIALNCHNVEHMILERYSRIEENVAKKCYARAEAYLMRIAEHRGLRRATLAMVCSKNDGDALRRLNPDVSIFVVPNSVDTDSYDPDGNYVSNNTGPVLLFQGSMDWYPNRDAVEFFAGSILPLVRVECPNVRFIVAGKNPPAELVSELGSIAEFTGTIPDMRPYLAAATVVVVPLRVGGGTRIKILEACAAGRAVVSTTLGAEGLGLQSGKEIVLADDPNEFARCVIALLQSSSQRSALGKRARAVVVERYSHVCLKRTLEAAISHLNLDAKASISA